MHPISRDRIRSDWMDFFMDTEPEDSNPLNRVVPDEEELESMFLTDRAHLPPISRGILAGVMTRLDNALPDSVHRLALLRWILTALLGVVLIGVPIIMQDIPEPQPFPFLIIIGLYIAWALVQNKLVRIYSGIGVRPAEVCRVWARTPYGTLAEEPLSFEIFRLRRAEVRGGDPFVELVRPMESMSTAGPLRSVSACCCCYTDFEHDHVVAVLVCGHIFCETCIVSWSLSARANAGTCPVCRHNFETNPGLLPADE
mmetsp:Transcript_46315/g.108525  ORF Transcript_46315/g.108525 Transcript_46315/m.108525 type:complete len:256 (+) Transcript_46315:62-829(+)